MGLTQAPHGPIPANPELGWPPCSSMIGPLAPAHLPARSRLARLPLAPSLLAHDWPTSPSPPASPILLKSPERSRLFAHLTVSSLDVPFLTYSYHLLFSVSTLSLAPFSLTPLKLLLSQHLTSRLGGNTGVSVHLLSQGYQELCPRMLGKQTGWKLHIGEPWLRPVSRTSQRSPTSPSWTSTSSEALEDWKASLSRQRRSAQLPGW